MNDPKTANNHYNNKKTNHNNKKLNGYCNNNHDSNESGKTRNKYSKIDSKSRGGRKAKVSSSLIHHLN